MNFKKECDIAYEKGTPILNDDEYDAVFGENANSMGVNSRCIVTLPFWMGSLNKARSSKSLMLWLNNNKSKNFVVSGKMDGISALRTVDGLFSRGNGKMGCDLKEYLSHLNIPNPVAVAVRGELIMKKNVFADKYSYKFKNARNLVAGQFGSKNIDSQIIKDIDFVAYETIRGIQPQTEIENQLKALEKHFKVVQWVVVEREDVTFDKMMDILSSFQENSMYQLDGLVISANKQYERIIYSNPKYSIAVKRENDIESVEATVTKVQWNASRWGVYIPVVHIEPVSIGGVSITKLSGHNAKYIIDNKINTGATIICVRSGDVIPHIIKVTKQSLESIKLPSTKWNEARNNVIVEEENSESHIKRIVTFLTKLGMKNVNLKTIEKIYNRMDRMDKMDDVLQILLVTDEQLSDLFRGEKTRIKIIEEFQRIVKSSPPISVLISASGVLGYGIGDKRVETIIKKINNFTEKCPAKNELESIDGISTKLSDKIISNHYKMIQFISQCRQIFHVVHMNNNQKIPIICLSGFRVATHNYDCIFTDTFNKDCNLLIIKDETFQNTNKAKLATKYGTSIITKAEFELNVKHILNDLKL